MPISIDIDERLNLSPITINIHYNNHYLLEVFCIELYYKLL